MGETARFRMFSIAILLLLATLLQCAGGRDDADPAQDIIDKYFEAIGGKRSIEAVDNLVMSGYYGSVFVPQGDSMTLYLKKPYSLRRESFGRVITFDGENGYINVFGELTEAGGDNLASLRYYAGFFHNCFSLLKFGDALDDLGLNVNTCCPFLLRESITRCTSWRTVISSTGSCSHSEIRKGARVW
jgi:hypothetical protein